MCRLSALSGAGERITPMIIECFIIFDDLHAPEREYAENIRYMYRAFRASFSTRFEINTEFDSARISVQRRVKNCIATVP